VWVRWSRWRWRRSRRPSSCLTSTGDRPRSSRSRRMARLYVATRSGTPRAAPQPPEGAARRRCGPHRRARRALRFVRRHGSPLRRSRETRGRPPGDVEQAPRISLVHGGGVEAAVFGPGEHDALDVRARLVIRDLLDERFHVARATRFPPLAHAPWAGVVRRDGQPRLTELLDEAGED